ncbi:hypothetical protein AJ79_03404 [Helicocarpus griseus UAMH5409]|uniref:Uncharacterized protein n=1 Tax=Helicocarpus griseus UAMH5409 TaxID=1447875 RepID=A0A2B7XX95_9EURO|nr:hypothetical protein AJ79_03404 [Helicocarpus griseus UAMH5409]
MSHPPRPPSSRPPSSWWTQTLSIDLLLTVLQKTILHPFLAWLIPLCLRAQATPYTHPSFIYTTVYASILSLVLLADMLSKRIAYGLPRGMRTVGDRGMGVDGGGKGDGEGEEDEEDEEELEENEEEEEVVVVAGGASGLGLLIAETYGMRGVGVAVLDIKDVGEVEEWEESHRARYFRCDVGDWAEVERVKERIERELGAPTILINSIAAPINALPITTLPHPAITRTIHANLLSYFNTLQLFLPAMLTFPTGGTIVTLSSVVSYLTPAGLSDYTATKTAISAVHKTVEAELRQSGHSGKVKMLLVETGQMATPLFEEVETPNGFFAPVLEPVQVAREIVAAIDGGNGGVIRLPAYAKLVSWYAVLPVAVQRLARFLSGIDRAVEGGRLELVPQEKEKEREKAGSSQKSSVSDMELIEVDY